MQRKKQRKTPSETSDRWLLLYSEGRINHTHGEKIRHLKAVGYLNKRGTLTVIGNRVLVNLRLLMQARKDYDTHVEQTGRPEGDDLPSEDVTE